MSKSFHTSPASIGVPQLYLVLQWKADAPPPHDGNVVMEIVGAYTTHYGAVRACRNRSYFIMPLVPNESAPDETCCAGLDYYPWMRRAIEQSGGGPDNPYAELPGWPAEALPAFETGVIPEAMQSALQI